jgi:hypothetical protein
MPGSAIARGRERFQSSGTVAGLPERPRPEVLASWLRCQEQYGVDPTRTVAEVRGSPADSSPLRVVADPVLDTLLPTVTVSEHLLLLSDEQGQLLRVDGYRPLVRLAAHRNIVVGSVWDEATAGTNGIGTALENGTSCEVVQGEHFCEGWQDLTCTGGLVRHPVTRGPAGVVDVTGYRTLPQPHTLTLIESTARLIEREWAVQILQRAWLVADVYATTASRYPRRPILAFDADGHLVRANTPGCTLLDLDPLAMAGQLMPLQVAPAAGAAVVDELRQVAPADIRAREVPLLIPAAGSLAAVLVPVVREGRVLGGIAIVADAPSKGPAAPGWADSPARAPAHPLGRLVARGEDGRLVLVDVHMVSSAHADGRGIWLCVEGRTLRSTYQSLQALAEALPADLFFQANRGDLVNLEWLAEIEQVLDQSYDLILRDSHRTRIPVSRRRLSRLREILHF